MPSFIVIVLWTFCALVLLFICCSFVKAMCNGSPNARTSNATAAASAATAAASVAGTANRNDVTAAAAAAARNVLSSLPIFAYSAAGQKTKLNCSVCLNDFKEGEKGRFLPRCFHCYHVECVDEWLTSHSECPVCRASIDPEAGELPV